MIRVLYVVHHPIHYQTPLLRRLAARPEIALKVAYITDIAPRRRVEDGGDAQLPGGFDYEFAEHVGACDHVSAWRPFAYGMLDQIRRESIDVLWIHGYAQISLVAAILVARWRRIPIVLRGESSPPAARRSLGRRLLKRGWLRWLLPRCDAVLYIGTANREYYRRHGVPDSKLFFMPYAVDNAYFQERAAAARPHRDELRGRLGLERDRPVVMATGNLNTGKRPFDLLEAYAKLSPDGRAEPAPYLLFVGDGPLRPALDARVRELGWSSIRLLGFQTQSQLPALYDLCDLFVMPSGADTWGMVVNEAMNAGCPLVVSDQVGAAVDLVAEGVTGWTFPAGDVVALEHCLRVALSDLGRLAEMGRVSLSTIDTWNLDEDVRGFTAAMDATLRRQARAAA